MTDLRRLASASALDRDEMTHWASLIACGTGYTRISIPQKRRRPREVVRPSVGLDRVLKQLHLAVWHLSSYYPPPEVHGFVSGRDIVTNATEHLAKDMVLKVDLRDFFGTIDRKRVMTGLSRYGFDEDAASAVAGLTLVEGSLAQGFSTSPYLSNLVFIETDEKISRIALANDVVYTRYVDDLTFSGSFDDVHDAFLSLVSTALSDLGWTVNPGKTRFMRRGKPQYVTGLYVGDGQRPHIPRSMKRLLRREVYYALKFGLQDARLRSPTPMEHDRLNGWVHYAAHADPMFGSHLRDEWESVPTRRHSKGSVRDWKQLLADIDFPDDW